MPKRLDAEVGAPGEVYDAAGLRAWAPLWNLSARGRVNGAAMATLPQPAIRRWPADEVAELVAFLPNELEQT